MIFSWGIRIIISDDIEYVYSPPIDFSLSDNCAQTNDYLPLFKEVKISASPSVNVNGHLYFDADTFRTGGQDFLFISTETFRWFVSTPINQNCENVDGIDPDDGVVEINGTNVYTTWSSDDPDAQLKVQFLCYDNTTVRAEWYDPCRAKTYPVTFTWKFFNNYNCSAKELLYGSTYGYQEGRRYEHYFLGADIVDYNGSLIREKIDIVTWGDLWWIHRPSSIGNNLHAGIEMKSNGHWGIQDEYRFPEAVIPTWWSDAGNSTDQIVFRQRLYLVPDTTTQEQSKHLIHDHYIIYEIVNDQTVNVTLSTSWP